jgi:quercetin dioxygenase-like cupin family protein
MSDYTIASLKDVTNAFAEHGWPGEMKYLSSPLNTEQVAITYRKMPKNSGGKGGYGHFHHTQEEVIFLIKGELEVKLGNEIKILNAGDTIRIAPSTVRSIWNAKDETAELIIASTKLQDKTDDSEIVPDFWPADIAN